MGLRALLVYPEMPPTYWSMKYALRFIGKKASLPPLGLLTVAALLPEDWEVTLVDMNVEPLRESAVAAADIVFTSSMLVQKDSLERLIRLCKKHGRRVVAGGPYPDLVLRAHRGGGPLRPERGGDHASRGSSRTSSKARPSGSTWTRPSPTSPSPRRRASTSFVGRSTPRWPCSSPEAAPLDCEFCDIIELFGRKPRTKSPTQFLAELDALYDGAGAAPVFVVDDNFIGNRQRSRRLLPEVAAWQRSGTTRSTFFTEATLTSPRTSR